MSEPYLGEIMIFAGNFAPNGWAFCNGATIPMQQNQPLYNLIENTYGGIPYVEFALPNISGRVPIHAGQGVDSPINYPLGDFGGYEEVMLTAQQMPSHTHIPMGAASATNQQTTPNNAVWAADPSGAASIYYQIPSPPALLTSMMPGTVGATGGWQQHENMQPSLALNFCICVSGTYPTPAANPV